MLSVPSLDATPGDLVFMKRLQFSLFYQIFHANFSNGMNGMIPFSTDIVYGL
jgi:hypothetical protein